MAQEKPLQLQLHTIAITPQTSVQDIKPELEKVVALYNYVFNPFSLEGGHWAEHIENWLPRLERPYSKAIYITQPNGTTPQGFFLMGSQTWPEIGHETLHVSLAAVDPSARGTGLFPLLLEETKQHARNVGLTELSICTFPERFPKMYKILSENGWELMGKQQDEWGTKCVFRLKL